MATRTSTRSTKAVKFVDSAGSDDEEDVSKATSPPAKLEARKPRGRPTNARRSQRNDDEDWDVRNEQHVEDEHEDDQDDEDEDEEEDDGDDAGSHRRDSTKKFRANQSVDSVYDFRYVKCGGRCVRLRSLAVKRRENGSNRCRKETIPS